MEHKEERELVSLAREGNQAAFGELVRRNQGKIYNLCYRMMGNPEDAQDVCQEAFVKAWQALPNFKGESSFGTWLYRLASNSSIDLIRKKKRRQESSLTENYPEEDEGTELQIPDERYMPEFALGQKELRGVIQKGLDLLPEHQKQVLILREIEGLSYQEISDCLDLDLGTVKSRIARGRGSLRKFLQKEGFS